MESRRKFLKLMAWFAMSVNLLLNPCFSFVRTVYSKARKIILPKDTNRETLKSRNPRSLNTTNLEITPLKEFDTMGLIDHVVDLKKWHHFLRWRSVSSWQGPFNGYQYLRMSFLQISYFAGVKSSPSYHSQCYKSLTFPIGGRARESVEI